MRDIEACLRAQRTKLYHLGIRTGVARSTLADANEQRDWRIYADFAQRVIAIARRLYAEERFALELMQTVYALDASLIQLCLSMFPWARYHGTKAAVKLHTLMDLRGSIPAFLYISDGLLHEMNILDQLIPEPGAFYVMDRAYIDFTRLNRFHHAGAFFVVRARSNLNFTRCYSAAVDRSTGLICDQTVCLNVYYSRAGFPEPLRRIKMCDADTGKAIVLITNRFQLPALTASGTTYSDEEKISMNGLLKGNFEVKHQVNVDEKKDEADSFKQEFRKKALESIGGSMVFVERRLLVWDGGKLNDENKK